MKPTIHPTWAACVLAVVLCSATVAPAATFYVDPINGSMAGDGSAGSPWSTLAEVISGNLIESMKPAANPYAYGEPLVARNPGAPVQPGDTLELLTGDHGVVQFIGYYNTDWITLKAADGHTPILQSVLIRGGRFWAIDGVTISKEPYGTPDNATAMDFNTHSWWGPVYDCIIENSHIYGVDDTSAFDAADWLATTGNGVTAAGFRITVRGNTIRNILLGISAGGDDCLIEYNTLTGIAHDGLRSGADRIIWQYNQLSDFVDIDDNHDDIIQLYRGGGVPHVGVEIRGNYFDGRMISGRPLTTSPQGVGCFDGPYVDCRVENNVVMTAHYHGISLYDADNCIIVNNTVLDPSRQYAAWISIPNATNTTIRNNMSYTIPAPDAGAGIVVDHNIELTDALSDQIFVDWRNGDVHLKTGSLAIDAGDGTDAPTIDIDGALRPQGNDWDVGAYESGGTGNQTPVADAGADQNLTDTDDNGSEDATLDGSGSYDPDGTIVSYEWEESSAPIATGVGPTVTLNVGLHTIDLTVTDDGDATDSDSVAINVEAAAGGQTSSTSWQTFPLGSTETGVFTAEYDARPNSDNMDGVTGICLGTATTWPDLACIVRFDVSGNMDVRNGGAYGADTTMAYSAATSYHVRMVIDVPNDTYSVYVTPEGSSETTLATGYAFRTEQTGVGSLDSWAIQATVGTHTISNMTVGGAGNQPPVADAGPDQNVTDNDDNGSEDVTLDGSGSSDSDGTIVSYEWEEASVPIASGVSPLVTLSVAVHMIDLTVTDDDDATDSDNVVITVNPYVNVPPMADAGPDQNVTDNDDNGSEDVTLDGSGSSDSDGTIVSYEWEEASVPIASGVSPLVTLSVAVHTIDLTVTDDDTATDTDSVVITVNPYVNVPPTADAGPDQNVTDNDDNGSEDVTLDGSGSSDSDGTIVSYEWEEASVPIASGVSPVVTLSVAVHTIDLTVTDDDTATDSDSVVVTVNPAPPTGGPQLEVGVTTGIASSWTTVTLSASYTSMVVVGIANYDGNTDPVAVRIRNASGNSFDVRVDPAGGAAPGAMDVHWMVVEEGVYTQGVDGVTMEAVKYLSTVTDENNSWNGEARAYTNAYTSPVVLGQVMTYNDAAFSTFWCCNGSRQNPPDSGNLVVGKSVAEDPVATRADETVGYIVIESGSGTMSGIDYVAALGSDSVRGPDNSPPYTYSLSGLSNPQAVVASLAAMDGGNGGWALLYGANPLTATTLNLAIDEDQAKDSERKHTPEQVGYIVFDN